MGCGRDPRRESRETVFGSVSSERVVDEALPDGDDLNGRVPLLFLRGLELTTNERAVIRFDEDASLQAPFCEQYECKHRFSAAESPVLAQVLMAKTARFTEVEQVLIVDGSSAGKVVSSLLALNAIISLAKKAVENSYRVSRMLMRDRDLARVDVYRNRLLMTSVVNATVDFNNLYRSLLTVDPRISMNEDAMREMKVSDPGNPLEMIARELESLPPGRVRLVRLNERNDPEMYLAEVRKLSATVR